MGESMSRYSIVERLTTQKLNIITAKSQLQGDVETKKQLVTEAKSELKDWVKSVKEEQKKEKREMERRIERSEREAENAESRKENKEAAFDLKIKTIDDALTRIEEISKTAPQN